MAPIRVGLIGLTKATSFAVGAWAAITHLPSLRANPDYEIVALCNSSVASAESSKTFHKLNAKVKCYGSPEDLAADPDVDLVAVSVNVAKHYELAKPALLNGKDVFVEWPLGATTAQAEELAALAKQKGVKTVVGVQGRADPAVQKAREIIQSGKIGEIQSSILTFKRGQERVTNWFDGAEYILDKNSGGTALSIHFGHFLDSVYYLLGPITNINAILKNLYPSVNIINGEGKVIKSNVPKTAYDNFIFTAEVQSGAPLVISYRTVGATQSDGFHWLINGTDGEIEITAPDMGWQIGGTKLTLTVGTGESEVIDLNDNTFGISDEKVPAPGTNVGRLYADFAKENLVGASFESAVEVHKILDEIRKSAGD